MKIGIYNEPGGGALGGSEVSVAVLAEALAGDHEIEILHSYPTLTAEKLGKYAGVDLSRVQLRCVPRQRQGGAERTGNIWSRFRTEMRRDADLSNSYDLFISFAHRLPPFCASPKGVLMVLFPLFDPVQRGRELAGSQSRGTIWKRLRSAWIARKLRSRLGGYQVKLANSEFTRRWTQRRWRADCQVIFPPVNIDFESAKKSNHILSVGRFAASGTGKKQLEMIEAFRSLKASTSLDWSYDCVGASGPSEEEQAFLAKVRRAAAETGANVSADVDRGQLLNLYQRAKIFWHATGMGIDESLNPEKLEHFGMTTVEAMAAGCVPVVINKGGQSEIVEHGTSGFLWDTLEEWQRYTAQLMRDPALVERMSRAAKDRARLFSRHMFIERFRTALSPLIVSS